MLLDEVRGDARRVLRTRLVPEDADRNALAFAGIQPLVGFETRRLAQQMHEGVLDPATLLAGSKR